jgi:hypothetical protein
MEERGFFCLKKEDTQKYSKKVETVTNAKAESKLVIEKCSG